MKSKISSIKRTPFQPSHCHTEKGKIRYFQGQDQETNDDIQLDIDVQENRTQGGNLEVLAVRCMSETEQPDAVKEVHRKCPDMQCYWQLVAHD